MTVVAQVVIDEQNPWPGLEAFDEASERFFNGRGTESAELRRLVLQAPLTVLFGASGLGKTSLVQAGLFPLLRKDHLLPVYVRLDFRDRTPLIDQVKSALQTQIHARQVDAPSINGDESLWEYLHRAGLELWSEHNQLLTPLFVLDQFEEVFTLGADSPAAIAQLRVDLADLIENRMPAALAKTIQQNEVASAGFSSDRQRYRVVLSFREDFLPALEGWKRELPSILRNRLRLLPMTVDQAFEAVHTTAADLVDEPLARRIVRFVAAADESRDPQVDPALLSVVCRELNIRRIKEERNTITEDLLEQSRADILNDFYERGFEGLNPGARIFVEDRLLTSGGFRGTVPLDDAIQTGIPEREMRTLIDRRLIRIEERLGIPHLELTHDVLTEVVKKSKGDRQQREMHERERQRRKARERELQRSRRLLVSVSAAALVFLSLLIWSWISFRRAVAAKAEAKLAETRASNANRDLEKTASELGEFRQQVLRQNGWSAEHIKNVALNGPVIARSLDANKALLDLPSKASAVSIFYYGKAADWKEAMDVLFGYWRSFGYRPTLLEAKNTAPTNVLWFRGSVALLDLKRIALSLIRAGVELQAIKPLSGPGTQGAFIGFDLEFSTHPPWTAAEIMATEHFDSPRSGIDQAYVAVYSPTPAEAAKAEDFLNAKGISYTITLGSNGSAKTIATGLKSKASAKQLTVDMQVAGIKCEIRYP